MGGCWFLPPWKIMLSHKFTKFLYVLRLLILCHMSFLLIRHFEICIWQALLYGILRGGHFIFLYLWGQGRHLFF